MNLQARGRPPGSGLSTHSNWLQKARLCSPFENVSGTMAAATVGTVMRSASVSFSHSRRHPAQVLLRARRCQWQQILLDVSCNARGAAAGTGSPTQTACTRDLEPQHLPSQPLLSRDSPIAHQPAILYGRLRKQKVVTNQKPSESFGNKPSASMPHLPGPTPGRPQNAKEARCPRR